MVDPLDNLYEVRSRGGKVKMRQNWDQLQGRAVPRRSSRIAEPVIFASQLGSSSDVRTDEWSKKR